MNSFTAETRRQLKREQKTRVMENLGRCIGIQLMYLVPYVLLMVILYVSVFGRAFALIAGGVSAKRLPADGGALARTEYHLAVHCAHAGDHGPPAVRPYALLHRSCTRRGCMEASTTCSVP